MLYLVLVSIGAIALAAVSAFIAGVGFEFILYKLGHKDTLFHINWKNFLK